jgi:hypothetical protein
MNQGIGNRDFGKHDDKKRALIKPQIAKSRCFYVNFKPFLEETKLISSCFNSDLNVSGNWGSGFRNSICIKHLFTENLESRFLSLFKLKSRKFELQPVLNNFFKGCWKIYIL